MNDWKSLQNTIERAVDGAAKEVIAAEMAQHESIIREHVRDILSKEVIAEYVDAVLLEDDSLREKVSEVASEIVIQHMRGGADQ